GAARRLLREVAAGGARCDRRAPRGGPWAPRDGGVPGRRGWARRRPAPRPPPVPALAAPAPAADRVVGRGDGADAAGGPLPRPGGARRLAERGPRRGARRRPRAGRAAARAAAAADRRPPPDVGARPPVRAGVLPGPGRRSPRRPRPRRRPATGCPAGGDDGRITERAAA